MTYVDFSYYSQEYFGTLNKEDFKPLVVKASKEIDKNINCELTEEVINSLSEKAQDKLKYTACALTDLINKKEASQNRKVSIVSVDGVSKHYNIMPEEDYKKSKKDIINGLPIELTSYL